MLRDHSNKWKQKYTSFWWKPLRTNHKWPHSSTLVVFLRENELFQRGWGGLCQTCGNSEGVGGHRFPAKMENPGRWGGVLCEIPSVVGVWIFSGTTHCSLHSMVQIKIIPVCLKIWKFYSVVISLHLLSHSTYCNFFLLNIDVIRWNEVLVT